MIHFFNTMFHSDIWIFILVIIAMIFFYMLPTLLAWANRKRQILAIFMLNIFAGWTGIGWFIALIWGALRDSDKTTED